jgi:hypothetical protein
VLSTSWRVRQHVPSFEDSSELSNQNGGEQVKTGKKKNKRNKGNAIFFFLLKHRYHIIVDPWFSLSFSISKGYLWSIVSPCSVCSLDVAI